jgi:hypothetical protein
MAQANDSPTTTGAPGTHPAAPSPRISFQSAGAVRRPRPTPLAVPAVQAAHIALIGALASLKPSRIVGHAADRFDIEGRAQYLDAVLAAVATYVKAVVDDTAWYAPIGYINAKDVGLLRDAASDIVGGMMNAVDRMIDDAAQAAE